MSAWRGLGKQDDLDAMRISLRRTLNPNHSQICQTTHLWAEQGVPGPQGGHQKEQVFTTPSLPSTRLLTGELFYVMKTS